MTELKSLGSYASSDCMWQQAYYGGTVIRTVRRCYVRTFNYLDQSNTTMLPAGDGGLMAGKAVSFCRAFVKCCPLVAGFLLSLPLSISRTARSLSVAGSSTTAFIVRACIVTTCCHYMTTTLMVVMQQDAQHKKCHKSRGDLCLMT